MAAETKSEYLVRLTNKYYRKQGKAKINKNEPYTRLLKDGFLFSGSRGLDFSGILKDGKHISFEVKETEKEYVPMGNIRMSQIDAMEEEYGYTENVFLLVCFKKEENYNRKNDDEWYLLDWPALKRLVDMMAVSIPKRYFQAFGYMVPSNYVYPDYLSPEAHPQRNILQEGFPGWISVHGEKTPKEYVTDKSYLDPEVRKKRIMSAMVRGVGNAKKREEKVEKYKARARDERQKRSDSSSNR